MTEFSHFSCQYGRPSNYAEPATLLMEAAGLRTSERCFTSVRAATK
jgi:hypothetical protein